ncbi:hypothetical protein SAMN05216564_10479 [Halopenitus persicus]|uniref:Uncharacterized protein n=1 Tax=Halopenitus persicus TaxID=1048396 RepID=A0A1H3IDK2_9EURY|nr:hypothetical protein SAMN05216564_10479 [Halopenitus persicus]
MSTTTIRGTVAGLGRRANPAFAGGVVLVAVCALGYALTVASLQHHTYVHVMAGVLWTGIDLFIGAVLGPVLGGLEEEQSAAVFERLTPKTAFLLPSLAAVTIASGIVLAQRVGLFPNAEPWIALFTLVTLVPVLLLLGWRFAAFDDRRWRVAFAVVAVGSGAWVATTVGSLQPTTPAVLVSLAIVAVLSIQGFGFLLPGEIRMYREMIADDPDPGVIAAIGQQNAKLGGVQGILQLVLILVMVYLRYRGF